MGNRFGQQVSMEGTHKGTDIQAVEGTPVVAPFNGRVVNVQYDAKGLGLKVTLENEDTGEKIVLSHLHDEQVDIGQQVEAGQPIGHVGSTGAGSTGPHLDVREQDSQGNYVNPEMRLPPEMQMMGQSPNTVQENGSVGGGQAEPPGPPGDMFYDRPGPPGWEPPKLGDAPSEYSSGPRKWLQWGDRQDRARYALDKHPYFGNQPYDWIEEGDYPSGGQATRFQSDRYNLPEAPDDEKAAAQGIDRKSVV